MPLYSYECRNKHTFDEFNSVEKRARKKCPECGVTAKQVITPVRLDYLSMGTSLSFPTAADKWAKMHEKEARRKSE